MKYMAIKLAGFEHWIWFERDRVIQDNSGGFIAEQGWGARGEATDVNIDPSLIEGRIVSNALQYE